MNKPNQDRRKDPKKESRPDVVDYDPLSTEINRQVGDLLPQGSREEIVRRITSVVYSENFSGPIAHPRHLKQYEDILPGSADRIIAMAEKQQDHHIEMAKTIVEKEYGDRKLGLWLGAGTFFILIAAALFSTIYVGMGAGAIFLAAAAVGGVALFVNGRSGNSEKEKN